MLEAHWLGHQVELARSTGGVLAFADPWEAVLQGQISPWPPPELVQKLYQSRQVRAYTGSDNVAATRSLGYYCDLQSVHSEDVVTWSLFGPLAYAAPGIRVSFARQLFGHLGLAEPVTNVSIWLVRRLPHPDTLVPGGPEIDVGIQTDSVLILGEAKWRSDVGSARGVDQNKDQIEIRTDFCCKYGTRAYPSVRHSLLPLHRVF